MEDDDFALADSFINFDIAAADSPTSDNPPELPIIGSASFGVENEVNVIENDDINGDIIANDEDENDEISCQININDDNVNQIDKSESESYGSSSRSEREDEYELEEGEIVDSDIDVDDDDQWSRGRSVRSWNELENLPWVPPVNVNLGPHHKMLPVGVVSSIVGAKVIVEGVEKHAPLNEGSILWITERQTPLGLVDDIFGHVTSPYYVVRYNYENEVPEGIRKGTLVSFVAEFVNHVLDNKDLYEKGYDEDMSDEVELEFSDDEKEAEYKRRQKQNKRGRNNRNPKTKENDRKKVTPNGGSVPTMPFAPAPTMPFAPAAPLVGHGHYQPTRQDFFGVVHGHSSSLAGTGQHISGAPNVNPPFPPVNGCPNLFTTGVWTNAAPLPPQQSAMPANGFSPNGVPWHPENTRYSPQLPTQGTPFQQRFNPSHRFPPPNLYPGPGGQPNMHAEPMYAQGPMNQNLRPPVPWFQQAPTNFHPNSISGNQGGPPNQFNPPASFHSGSISGNQHGPPNQLNPPTNFHSNYISGNLHPPQSYHQFNPGSYDGHGRTFSTGRGRRPFHRGGRGWKPAR